MNKRRVIGASVLAWAVLHLYTSVRTLFENMYYTYTGWSWFFLGLWLSGLLALDALLYFFGGAKLLRSLKWYWGFSAVLAAGGLLIALEILWSDWATVVGILCSLPTPLNQLLAFSWLLFDELAGIKGHVLFGTEWSAVLLFCLLHFAYTAWLHRRAEKGGEAADGPVGPGTGAMG